MTTNVMAFAAGSFAAARKLDGLPSGHKAAARHGHDFVASVFAAADEHQWARFPGDEPAFLQSRLATCIATLDYADLNEIIDSPGNENLARYVSTEIEDIPGIRSVGIQCAQNFGVELDDSGLAGSWQAFRFEAAHQLPNVPAGHQCGRMHGHSFGVVLHRKGSDDEGTLGELWERVESTLHHACLNDVAGLENPTSEMIATWIWNQLSPLDAALSCVTIREGITAGCHFDGSGHCIWKDLRFESARSLRRAPDADRRHRLHGHSFLARLFLAAPVDEVLGWTVDYGDVKSSFRPVCEQLDHHTIDYDESGDSDAISLSLWIRNRIADDLPQLYRIDLFETPGCGASLNWGPRGPSIPVSLNQ